MTSILWVAPVFGGVISAISTPLVIRALTRLQVVDVASERSSHSGVALRGTGVATLVGFIAGAILGLALLPRDETMTLLIVSAGAVLGGFLGLAEDIQGLPVRIRAGVQLVIGFAVCLALLVQSDYVWWWTIPAAVFIAGYINAANFMDGLNGISGIHGGVAGLFYVLLGALTGNSWLLVAGGLIALCFAAFLPWNLLRPGTFLGDSGSYLLGALVACTAVGAWSVGIHLLVAAGPLIIYCVDTGGTLLRRVVRRETWFEPHRTHVYQRVSSAGMGHIRSSLVVGGFTAAVAGLSLAYLTSSILIQAAALVAIIVLCLGYWLLPQLVSRFSGRSGISADGTARA